MPFQWNPYTGMLDYYETSAGGGGGGVALSAGTQSVSTGTVKFADSNGISFGMSGSSQITATYTVPTLTNSSWTVSDNGTSGTVARLAFTNQNGVTLSLSTGAGGSHTIVGSHNALTSQSNQAFSAAGGSSAFQTLSFSNANGVSFSNNAGQVQGSVAAQTAQTAGIYITAQSTGQSSSSTYDARTLSMVGDGIVSIGWSNSTLRVSATQSNQAFSAAGGSSAFQTLSFSDNAYASWTNNAGQVAITELRASVLATGNTEQSSSGTINLDTLIVRGSGAASVGVSNGSLIIDAPNAGAGNVTFSAGTSSAGIASLVFSNSNNVSFGMNGSTITATAGPTLVSESWVPAIYAQTNVKSFGSTTTANVTFMPFVLENSLSAGAMGQFISLSFSTAGAVNLTHTVGFQAALYSRGTGANSTTMGSFWSSSFTIVYSANTSTYTFSFPTTTSYSGFGYGSSTSAGQNITSNFTGPRLINWPLSNSGTTNSGLYWFAVMATRSTAGSSSSGLFASYIGAQFGTAHQSAGVLGVAQLSTGYDNNQHFAVLGSWSSSASIPASVAYSAISRGANADSVGAYLHFWST